MKKIIFLFIVSLILLIANSCQKIDTKNQTLYIPKIHIDKEIGIKHNEGLKNFINTFKNSHKENQLTNQQQIEFSKQYFIDQFDVDITPIVDAIKSNLKEEINSKPISSNIDIKGFVSYSTKNFSQYFKSRVNDILKEIENCNNDKDKMLLIVKQNIENSVLENNFANNEKEHFINMLYVYQSSIEFWYEFLNSNTMSKPISPNDYWKIPTADWAGGIIGTIGGPVGGLVGYLASSVTMAIGLI